MEGNQTGPDMEQCYNFNREECEIIVYVEQCHPMIEQVCVMTHCTERCGNMTIQEVEYSWAGRPRRLSVTRNSITQ